MKYYGFLLVILTCLSCETETCRGVDYINGLSLKNGLPYSGKCVTHNVEGAIRSIRRYKNGYDHGEWRFYYDNGQLEVIGEFFNGEKIGQWKYFYENGSLKNIQSYNEKGVRTGKWVKYDSIGNIIETTQYQ